MRAPHGRGLEWFAQPVNDVGKAPGHCDMPAVNAAPAAVALVLVSVHGFVTYQLHCAFPGAGSGSARRVGRVWEQESPSHGHTNTKVFCFVGFAVGLLEVRTSVD